MSDIYHTTLNNKEVAIKYAYNPEGMRVDTHPFEVYPGLKASCEIVAVFREEENITGKLSSEELESLEAECLTAHEDYAKKQNELRRMLPIG